MSIALKLQRLRFENSVTPHSPSAVLHLLVHAYDVEDIDHLLQVLVDQNERLEYLKSNEESFTELEYHMKRILKTIEEK